MRSGSAFLLFMACIFIVALMSTLGNTASVEDTLVTQDEFSAIHPTATNDNISPKPTTTISRVDEIEATPTRSPFILDRLNIASLIQLQEVLENLTQATSIPQATPTLQPTSTPLGDRPAAVPEDYVGISSVVWTTFYVPEACHLKRTLPDGSTEWSEWFIKWVEDGEERSGAESGSYNYLINCSSTEGWFLMGGMNIFEDCDGSCFDIAASCPMEITLFYNDGSKSGFVVEFIDAPGIGSRRCLDTGGSITLLDPWIDENGELVLSFDIDVLVPMFDPSGANSAEDYTPANWGSSYYAAKLWVPAEDAQDMIRTLSNPQGTPTPTTANQPNPQE